MKVDRATSKHLARGALVLGGILLSVQLAHGTPKEGLRQLYRTGECPGCDLRGVDLYGAIMWRTNLASADLSGAELSQAGLREADLTGAKLKAARLSDADMVGAVLKQ